MTVAGRAAPSARGWTARVSLAALAVVAVWALWIGGLHLSAAASAQDLSGADGVRGVATTWSGSVVTCR